MPVSSVAPTQFQLDEAAQKDRQQNALSLWLEKYANDCVAHAIDAKNVANTLDDGFLRSGEEVLRKTGRAEFEMGAVKGSRGSATLPQFSTQTKAKIEAEGYFEADDESFPTLLQLYQDKIAKYEKIGRRDMRKPLGREEKIQEGLSVDERKANRVRNRLDIAVCAEVLASEFFGGFQWKQYCDEQLKLPELQSWFSGINSPKEKQYIRPLIAIALDEALPKERRLYSQLSTIYTTYQKMIEEQKIDINGEELGFLMNAIREVRLVSPLKITNVIRVVVNASTFSYGPVCVLRGESREVLGAFQDEFYLRAPEQNGGHFFQIALNDPKAVVIGPKELLSKYADRANVIFEENLTQAQHEMMRAYHCPTNPSQAKLQAVRYH